MFLMIFTVISWAGEGENGLPGKQLYIKDTVSTTQSAPIRVRSTEKAQYNGSLPEQTSKPRSQPESTNLPFFYLSLDRSNYESAAGVSILPPRQAGGMLTGLKSGDVLRTILEHSIVASPSNPAPVRVRVLSGNLKDAILLGEATLDKDIVE